MRTSLFFKQKQGDWTQHQVQLRLRPPAEGGCLRRWAGRSYKKLEVGLRRPHGEESLEPHPQGGSWTHPRKQMLSDILETAVSLECGEEAT